MADFAKKAAQQANKEDNGFVSRMIMKIVDNIQITVKNIHIRFEDSISKKYAFGVTLQELLIQTVNKEGKPEFIDRTDQKFKNIPLRKKLLLSNFGIYWNEKTDLF